jgi:paraquat-inducible protein B
MPGPTINELLETARTVASEGRKLGFDVSMETDDPALREAIAELKDQPLPQPETQIEKAAKDLNLLLDQFNDALRKGDPHLTNPLSKALAQLTSATKGFTNKVAMDHRHTHAELHEMKRRMDGLKKVNLRVRDFTAITYAELERIARRHKLELVPTDDAIDLTGDLDPDEPGPGLPFHDD